MAALLNISPEAARDLEDNFVAVLDRELGGDRPRAREIARQLVERLDFAGYPIGREELHRDDDIDVDIDIPVDDPDLAMAAGMIPVYRLVEPTAAEMESLALQLEPAAAAE